MEGDIRNTKDDARKAALHVLNQVDRGRRTLDSILADIGADAFAIKRERALFNALVYGVLRWRGCIDHIIDHYSRIRLNKIDPKVLNILRLGIFQIGYMDRVPDAAAVNTSVDLVKTLAAPWIVGYVNAILRNASRSYRMVPFPDLKEDPVGALSARKSFPAWLMTRWLERFGLKKTSALCDRINSIPPISIRTNRLKTSREILMTSIRQTAKEAALTAYAPDGICFVDPKLPIPEFEAFRKGCFQVQDEAAQLVSLLLGPQPQETVLDACAGLGGKTGHIAQLMENKGEIVALDKNKPRLIGLETEMNRLGISIVSSRHQDLFNLKPHQKIGLFDRILLDAPCSGLGVLRRNPDIKWASSKKNFKRHHDRQVRLLDLLSKFLKPSGILVYAVCSAEPEESEDVIEAFLKNNHNFEIDQEHGCLPPNLISLIGPSGFLKTYPHLSDMDGFFMTRLKRVV
jgi:16S rRNA (cytosine967-C5)-methyltransferase